jgi:hypothetical protein
MSGIAVIHNVDGRAADGELLRRMLTAIVHRGPDGLGLWVTGPVALGHAMLRTSPQSLHEKQPLVDADAGLCLAMDGSITARNLPLPSRKAGSSLKAILTQRWFCGLTNFGAKNRRFGCLAISLLRYGTGPSTFFFPAALARHHLLANAYPVYTRNYARKVRVVRDALARIANLDVVGRAGLFFYRHLHDQLRLGKDYVEDLSRSGGRTEDEPDLAAYPAAAVDGGS